jgi:hypothetical protein
VSVLDVAGGIACQPLRSRSCTIAEVIRLKKIRIDSAGPAFPVERGGRKRRRAISVRHRVFAGPLRSFFMEARQRA